MKNMIGIGVLGIIEIYIPWCFYFHKGVWACERVTKAGGSLGKGTAQACQAGLPVLSCLPSFLPSRCGTVCTKQLKQIVLSEVQWHKPQDVLNRWDST